jgi:hypothetical protein
MERQLEMQGFSGWNHVNNMTRLTDILNQCYWFKYSTKCKRVLTFIPRDFSTVKSAVKQSIHTINGLLVKLFLAFPTETPGYSSLARFTEDCFVSLMKSYLGNDENSSPILDLKKFGKFVKSNFHKTLEARESILSYKFEYECFSLIEHLLSKLRSELETKSLESSPYDSIGWYYRMGILSQNRNLGYLPRSVADRLRKEYRTRISSPDEVPPKENLIIIQHCIKRALDDSMGNISFEEKEFADEMYSAVDMPVKLTASVDHPLHEGGKLEDARLILREFVEDKLHIPTYDLHSGKPSGFISYDGSGPFYSALFWYSLNEAIGYFVESKQLRGFLPIPTRRGFKNFFDAEIVHVSEPAKERNLTKSSAVMTWLLTPAGKIIHSILEHLPEHKIGLMGSNHGWEHQKEWGPSGERNNFLYDRDGYLNHNVKSFFQDWTESSDYINRTIGVSMLKALFEHVEFPKFYALLIMMIIKQPQPVREVIALDRIDDEDEFIRNTVEWQGSIVRGLMMGNPLTKAVLHMHHIVELEYAKYLLRAAA